MLKTTLYVASSLKGMMTEGDKNSSWVSEQDEIMFAKTCKNVGCILVGRQTFDQYQGVVYPVPETKNVVLTSEDSKDIVEQVSFQKNFDAALEYIENSGFDRFVVVGGAKVISQCLERKIVDRILLSVHPYIFGNGISIIGDYQGRMDLKFVSVREANDSFVLLEYEVINYK